MIVAIGATNIVGIYLFNNICLYSKIFILNLNLLKPIDWNSVEIEWIENGSLACIIIK